MITTIQIWHDGVPHIIIRDAYGTLIAEEDISDELYHKLDKQINSHNY